MLTIDDLPEDVFVLVFSYLSFKERQNLRVVSKHWLDLVDSSNLNRNHIFEVRQCTNLNEYRLFGRQANLRIEDIEYPLKHSGFWEQSGPSVKSAEILEVDLRSAKLYDIINHCPNIQFLTIRCGPLDLTEDRKTEWIGGKYAEKSCMNLQNLLGLDMEIERDIDGADFHTFIKFAFRLQFLRIDGLLEMNNLVVRSILCKPLRKLMLSPESVIQPSVDFFLGLGPQLTILYLTGLPGSLDDWLPKLAENFPRLEQLGITSGPNVLNKPSLLLSLENLKFLSFKGTEVGDDVLSAALHLKHLRGLDMSNCHNLTSDGIVRGFGPKYYPNLIDLRLIRVRAVNDKVLACILPRVPNLKQLHLGGRIGISREGLTTIINSCKLLEVLSLRHCLALKNWHSPVSVNNLEKLTYLNMSFNEFESVRHIRQRDIIKPEDFLMKLKLSKLETLWFLESPMSFACYKRLLSNCPALRNVYCETDELCEQQCHEVGAHLGKPFCLKSSLCRSTKFGFFGLNSYSNCYSDNDTEYHPSLFEEF